MSGTVAHELKELKELLDGGVLTQEEFDAQKTVILEKYKITQVAPAPVVGQPAQPAMMQPDQFLQAAGAGRLDEVNQYLEGGGDVNERDEAAVLVTHTAVTDLREQQAENKARDLASAANAPSAFAEPTGLGAGQPRALFSLSRPAITKAQTTWTTTVLKGELLGGLEPFATFPADEKLFPVPPMAFNSSSVDFAFELLLGVPSNLQPIMGVPYRAAASDGRPPQLVDPVRKDGLRDNGRYASGTAQLPPEVGRMAQRVGATQVAETKVALAYLDRAVMVGGVPTFTYRSTGNVAATRAISELICLCLEMNPLAEYDQQANTTPPDKRVCEKTVEMIVTTGELGDLRQQVIDTLKANAWSITFDAVAEPPHGRAAALRNGPKPPPSAARSVSAVRGHKGPTEEWMPDAMVDYRSDYDASGGKGVKFELGIACDSHYWEGLASALMGLLPPIDYDFEHTIKVYPASHCDWVHASEALAVDGADQRTPLMATRTAMDRARSVLDSNIRSGSGVKVEGTVTIWARAFAEDDPRTICALQTQQAKQAELQSEETRLEVLRDMGCCGCFGVADKEDIKRTVESVNQLKAELEDVRRLYSWYPLRLRDAQAVAAKWAEVQSKMIADFGEQLKALQVRTTGTLGFTLRDEWRYLSFNKEPWIDRNKGWINDCPLAPQVVNPRDHAWDASLGPSDNAKFATADLDGRLKTHLAFRVATMQATAMDPRADSDHGLFREGDPVRIDGTTAVHLPSKVRVPLTGAGAAGLDGQIATARVPLSNEKVGSVVKIEVGDGGGAELTNVPVPLSYADVERLRHEVNGHVAKMVALCSRMLAWGNVEATALVHLQAARQHLAQTITKATRFRAHSMHASTVASLSLMDVSSMGLWIAATFSIGQQYTSNLKLRRKLLAIANEGYVSGADKLVPPTPAAPKGDIKGKISGTVFKRTVFKGKMITLFTSKARGHPSKHYSIDGTCNISVVRGWEQNRHRDDLMFVREPHPELRAQPSEPGRQSVESFEREAWPLKTMEHYRSAISSWERQIASWFYEKGRYDEHKEWLWMTNEVGEAAQRVRCLEERIHNGAWERMHVRAPSEATGNWFEKTLPPNMQPFQIAIPAYARFYAVSRLNDLQWHGFQPPPHTWTEHEVQMGIERAKVAEAHARAMKEQEQRLAREEHQKADHFHAEYIKAKRHADSLDKENPNKAAANRAASNLKHQEDSHRSAARRHEAEAAKWAREEERQREIQQCLPIIRQLQIQANGIRERLQQVILETRNFFIERNNEVIAVHQNWAGVAELSGALPNELTRALTIRSHEGFEREVSKLGRLVEAAEVVLVRFANAVKDNASGAALDGAPDFAALCSRLLALHPFDAAAPEIDYIRRWLRASESHKLPAYGMPCDANIDAQRFHDDVLSNEAAETVRNLPGLAYNASASEAQERQRQNGEAAIIACAAINSGRAPFSIWYHENHPLYHHEWHLEKHPALVLRPLFPEKGAAEDEDEGEGDDEVEDELDMSPGGTQAEFIMHYPAALGEASAVQYMNSFLAPHSLRPVAEARNIPKWIWLKEHKYRLWYSEHAEWFHPMFITKKQEVEGIIDILNKDGLSLKGLKKLHDSFKGLEDQRIGGYTYREGGSNMCNLCFRRIEPTRFVLWDSQKMAEVEVDAKTYAFYNQATKADAASASGNIDPRIAPARRMLPMIKHISQGYFCQHRAMNSEALRVFNRCFSVCISCATSQHNTYFVSPTVAVATADPNEPGHLDRRVLPLRQDEYTVRLNKIELDFKDKCFSTNALTRGAPVGTRWDSIVDASLAAITRFGWTPIPQEGGLHHMLDGGAALGGLSIEALETPVHLSADEIENELMMGTPEFTGAIGTFPTFARSQNYYLNEVIPDLVNPALSRHAHSKNDGFLRVIELREKTKKKLKMTFEGGLDTLIKAFFDAEAIEHQKGTSSSGQYWRLTQNVSAKAKLESKALKKFVTEFLDLNGDVLWPTDGAITAGGRLDAPLHASAGIDKRTLSRKQSPVAMHFFAITVASFFYSRSRAKEQWTADATANEAHKEDAVEASLMSEAAGGDGSASEEAEARVIDARNQKIADAVEEIINNSDNNGEPPPSPLANSNREVPQFVRDVINIHYPLGISELEFQLIGVEELDLLFYHAAQPLKFVLSALHDISGALQDALLACHFGPTHRGTYSEVDTETGAKVRQRVYTETAPAIDVALRNIKDALRARELADMQAGGRTKWTPSWAPPKFSTKDMDVGAQTVAYSALAFSRYHIEDVAGEPTNPNEDLVDAMSKFELWWDINMQMHKVMGLQRSYVLFFCACAKTDQLPFVEMLKAQFGVDPVSGEPTESLKNACAALERNINSFKRMRDEVGGVMSHCSAEMAAVYKELNEWSKQWRTEEVKKAPNTLKTIMPFICELTRSGTFEADKRHRAAAKALKRIEPFYAERMDTKLDPFALSKLLNQIKAWPSTARVLGLDEDEGAAAVVTAYFPDPMSEFIEFENTLLPELNDKYNAVREDVSQAIERMAALDAQLFNLLARSRTRKEQPPAADLREAIVRVAQEVKAFNPSCKVHCFKPKSGDSTEISLEALVTPPSGAFASLKSLMGFRIQRVALPRQYQILVRTLEAMMEETKKGANAIEALERKVQQEFDGSSDAIKSYTKGTDKNLFGASKLTKLLKERQAGNSKEINAAVQSAGNNLKNLEKVVTMWKKYKKFTEGYYQQTLEHTVKKEKELFAVHIDISPTDYMREKLAPKRRDYIIDYIVCSIVTKESDSTLRESISSELKALVEVDVSLAEELVGEDRRDFVRWCCEETGSRLKASARGAQLTKQASILSPHTATDGSSFDTFAAALDLGASSKSLGADIDSGEEFYTDTGAAAGPKAAASGGVSVGKTGDGARLTQNQAKLAAAIADEKDFAAKLETAECQVPAISKEARKQMEEDLKFKRNKVEGLSTLNETLEQQKVFMDQVALAKDTFAIVKENAPPLEGFADTAWPSLSPAFGEIAVDDFPKLKPSGLMKLDLEMSKVRGPFRNMTAAIKRWKSARLEMFAACRAMATSMKRCPPTTLNHALSQLASVLSEILAERGVGRDCSPAGGVKIVAVAEAVPSMTSERAETLGTKEGRAAALAEYTGAVNLCVDGEKVALSKELSRALSALSLLACALDWDGGKEAKVVQARQAIDQLQKPREKLAKMLKAKLKKAYSDETKKKGQELHDKFVEETMHANSVQDMRNVSTRHKQLLLTTELPGVLKPEEIFVNYDSQLTVCEKQVSSDGDGLNGVLRGSYRMIKTVQSNCPKPRSLGSELSKMSMEALELIEAKLPDTNMLAPFESLDVESPLDCGEVDLQVALRPPEFIRQMMLDLSGTGHGVASYMKQLVKSITDPLMANLTGKVISAMAQLGKSILIELATLNPFVGPIMVIAGIRKAFKAVKMTYKLVNKGIKLKRSMQRALMLMRMKKRLKVKCKGRAVAAIKELNGLSGASGKLLKYASKDKAALKEFVTTTIPGLGKLPKAKGGWFTKKKAPEVMNMKPVELALPAALAFTS